MRARGHFDEEIKENMLRGIKIDNQLLRLSDIVDGDKTNSNRWYTVCLLTGRNREIRKIFESQGLQVRDLRNKFGPIFLPKGLKEGDWQELKSKDLEKCIPMESEKRTKIFLFLLRNINLKASVHKKYWPTKN